jgi:hypothetical protein
MNTKADTHGTNSNTVLQSVHTQSKQVAPSTGVLNTDTQLFKKFECYRTSRAITTTNPGNTEQSRVYQNMPLKVW